MCRWLVLCLLGLLSLQSAVAQQKQYAFRISFTDKAGAPPLSNPLTFLSQRALDRRAAQNISVDNSDRPVSPDYMDSVLTITSGKVHMTSRWMNYCVVLLTDSSKIISLTGKPYITDIKYIAYYPNGLHKSSGGNPKHSSEDKSIVFKTTGTAAYYGSSFTQTTVVNGDYLHDFNYKGQGMLIAVLDEGFKDVNSAPAFDSMMQSNRLVDQRNFVIDNNNVFDFSNHGTYSLSTMVGNLPGVYIGSAPMAEYALYVTEDGRSEQRIEMDNVVAATERADSIGADVINISLGYNQFNLPVFSSLTYADIDGKTTVAAQAANMATTKGILFVPSAGNEGGGSWNYILTPGDADSALTVGSVNNTKVPAANSGFGPNSAGHIKPNVCVVGEPASVMWTGTTPSSINGTSFAAPQLAGWAACLMQGTTGYTPYTIRTAIEKSAHIYPNTGAQLGYGVPNFRAAFDYLHVDSPILPTSSDWIKVGPNPFVQNVTLRVFINFNGTLDIAVTDVAGKVIYKKQERVYQGTQIIPVNLPELSSGVYYLKASTDNKEAVIKLVK